jgi:ankyrin repeat protein
MRPSLFAFLFAAATLSPAVAHAQGTNPQAIFWDSAMEGDTVAMAAALQRGAVVDSLDTRQNFNGRRALNWAAWFNRVPAIRFLLAHGATLEARNRTGFTALHHAAEAGSRAALEALLAAGADPQAANAEGVRPAETAMRKGHVQIATLLRAKSQS